MTDILIIASHPDDAEIALGGLIAKASSNGKKVVIVNFTVSEIDDKSRKKRIAAAEKAAVILGCNVSWVSEGSYDQVCDIKEYVCVKEVDKLVENYNPKIVITHTEKDSHADHVRLAKAVIASSRRWTADLYAFQPNEYRAPTYRSFQPNVFIDTSDFIEQKLLAIDCYNYGSKNFRSLSCLNIKELDASLGILNNCAYAEGLELIRSRRFEI